jgi:hypothetical protein
MAGREKQGETGMAIAALGVPSALMQRHDAADNGQAQSAGLRMGRARGIRAIKTVKDAFKMFRRDIGADIFDADGGSGWLPFGL